MRNQELVPVRARTVEIFGVARCLLASDFPVDKLHGDYDAAFDQITAGFSADERRGLSYDNAARFSLVSIRRQPVVAI